MGGGDFGGDAGADGAAEDDDFVGLIAPFQEGEVGAASVVVEAFFGERALAFAEAPVVDDEEVVSRGQKERGDGLPGAQTAGVSMEVEDDAGGVVDLGAVPEGVDGEVVFRGEKDLFRVVGEVKVIVLGKAFGEEKKSLLHAEEYSCEEEGEDEKGGSDAGQRGSPGCWLCGRGRAEGDWQGRGSFR